MTGKLIKAMKSSNITLQAAFDAAMNQLKEKDAVINRLLQQPLPLNPNEFYHIRVATHCARMVLKSGIAAKADKDNGMEGFRFKEVEAAIEWLEEVIAKYYHPGQGIPGTHVSGRHVAHLIEDDYDDE